MEGLLELSDLTPKVQNHLSKVYFFLATGIFSSFAVFIISQYLLIPNFILYSLLGVSIISTLITIFVTKGSSISKIISIASFYSYSVPVGGLLGNQIFAFEGAKRIIYYRICLSAFIYTVVLFAIFSIFTILTKNRLAIYGITSLLTFILSIISIFVWNVTAYLAIGIVSGLLYIIGDTQVIIYRASNSNELNPVNDAEMLFLDVVKLFYKIMQLFEKKEKDKEEKKKKKN